MHILCNVSQFFAKEVALDKTNSCKTYVCLTIYDLICDIHKLRKDYSTECWTILQKPSQQKPSNNIHHICPCTPPSGPVLAHGLDICKLQLVHLLFPIQKSPLCKIPFHQTWFRMAYLISVLSLQQIVFNFLRFGLGITDTWNNFIVLCSGYHRHTKSILVEKAEC